ncbi:MAG: hypothetical protein ABI427_20445 [Solirubrobacteraceae bacterium]
MRVATGELDASRLYDLRAFKTCWAELAYLHRLAAGGRHGGTVVTSMRQLVAGIAPLHPAWKLTGDPWEDRDRHHQSVRRRLSALAASGLLRWRIGLDEDLEERRTELELLAPPELLPDELAAAAARLEHWEKRYDPALNTPSGTGITDVKQAAAPLVHGERQRRGCQRARQKANAGRALSASKTISSPPSGAPPTSENNQQHQTTPTNAIDDPQACGLRTSVTRASAPTAAAARAALDGGAETARREEPGERGRDPQGFDVVGLLLRVETRRREREPVLAFIAGQVEQRLVDISGWGLERSWPVGRLREAWVAARFGAGVAAEFGASSAGRLGREEYLRLRRAVARFERNCAARPVGFPAGGLAGLLHLGELAAASGDGPRRLAFAIGAFDQLSRRMRAVATKFAVGREERAVRLARARRDENVGRASYRAAPRRLPRWVVCDQDGVPLIVGGELQVDEDWAPPGRHTLEYRTIARDAHILAQGRVPADLDGRQEMASHAAALPGGGEGRAPVGPYPRPADRGDPDRSERELLEFAHHASLSLHEARRVAPAVRAAILAQARTGTGAAIRADVESNESRVRRYEQLQASRATPLPPMTPDGPPDADARLLELAHVTRLDPRQLARFTSDQINAMLDRARGASRSDLERATPSDSERDDFA